MEAEEIKWGKNPNRNSKEIVNRTDCTLSLAAPAEVSRPLEQNAGVAAISQSSSWCKFEVRMTLIKTDSLLASRSPLMRQLQDLLIDICRSEVAASGKMELSLREEKVNPGRTRYKYNR